MSVGIYGSFGPDHICFYIGRCIVSEGILHSLDSVCLFAVPRACVLRVVITVARGRFFGVMVRCVLLCVV